MANAFCLETTLSDPMAGNNDINDVTIPALSSGSAFIKASYYHLMDRFLNTNGTSMSGKAPKIGPNWYVLSGTHNVGSNATVVSSVGGFFGLDQGEDDNYAFEAAVTVTSAVSAVRLDVRLNDDLGSANNRILLDWNGTNLRLREFFASATATQTWTTPFTQLNTIYPIRIEVRGANIKVFVSTSGVWAEYFNVTTSLLTGSRIGISGQSGAQLVYAFSYPIT